MGIIGLQIPHNAFVRVANIVVKVKRGKLTTYALLATQMMSAVLIITGELTITAHAILQSIAVQVIFGQITNCVAVNQQSIVAIQMYGLITKTVNVIQPEHVAHFKHGKIMSFVDHANQV